MKAIGLNGKRVFITGANGGLGFETVKQLAKLHLESLTLAARTSQKADSTRNDLRTEVKTSVRVDAVGGFDMNDPDAIQRAVAAMGKREPFDVIFLQVGGVFFGPDYQYINHKGMTIEKTIFQNTIGSYLTLVELKKRGLVADDARVVFAGGEGARGIPGMIEKPVFQTTDTFRNYVFGRAREKKYNPMNAIGVSKLASALLVQRLSRFNDGVTYLWFSPGLTHGTNGLAKAAPIRRFVMENIAFGISGLLGFSQSPRAGAAKYIEALTGKVGKNGDVLGAPEGKVLGKITDQLPMNPSLTDEALIEEFWTILQKVSPMEHSEFVLS